MGLPWACRSWGPQIRVVGTAGISSSHGNTVSQRRTKHQNACKLDYMWYACTKQQNSQKGWRLKIRMHIEIHNNDMNITSLKLGCRQGMNVKVTKHVRRCLKILPGAGTHSWSPLYGPSIMDVLKSPTPVRNRPSHLMKLRQQARKEGEGPEEDARSRVRIILT